ncbi:hypothetical protein [Streptomyces alboflavus]|uniref:hypothetical protein n=1 Tax=Streptomyces alboflavus TaxID=67267 RepID=UPI0036CD799A
MVTRAELVPLQGQSGQVLLVVDLGHPRVTRGVPAGSARRGPAPRQRCQRHDCHCDGHTA